jgi:multiple sugar transport system permease protein
MAAITSERSSVRQPRSRFRLPGNPLLYAGLIVVAFFIGFPLFIFASQSLMPNNEIVTVVPKLIPTNFTFEHYQTLFARDDLMLPRWLFNSLYTSTLTTLLTIAIAAPAAYSFARLEYPGRSLLFFILLITVMVPVQMTYIPNFLLMRDLKFLDSYNALIFPQIANVFAVFLLRQFFQSIPAELEEAARLDGASYFGVFLRIIIPLSVTAFTAMAIFVFLGNWNELVWALIVTNRLEMRTLPVGLSVLNGAYNTLDRGLVLSGAAFATIPVLILYVIFQRWIIKGITFTGMGGR